MIDPLAEPLSASGSTDQQSQHQRLNSDSFVYLYSCDLDDANFQIKIGTLEGNRARPNYMALVDDPLLKYSGLFEDRCSDLIVTCQLYSNGKTLCPMMQTKYKHFTSQWDWNEWIVFPLKLSELPRDVILGFTIWDTYGPRKTVPVGGTAVSIFGKYGCLRSGVYDLRVSPNVESNGNTLASINGKSSDKTEQISKFLKLKKKYHSDQMVKVDWLDRLTFSAVEKLTKEEKNNSQHLYLSIEFPKISVDGVPYSVVYFEPKACDMCKPDELCNNLNLDSYELIPDPEVMLENLAESKHHKLSRSTRSGVSDRDLKPNSFIRDQLNQIVNYPPTKPLTSEEQDIVWKYRFYLTKEKKALTKFLKCVKWDDIEAKQAIDLMNAWQPMDVEDALELLSSSYQHPAVRCYAVRRLSQASDDDLLLYLLQLVQALKYENIDKIKNSHDTASAATFQDRRRSNASLVDGVEAALDPSLKSNEKNIDTQSDLSSADYQGCDLATFLIDRASRKDTLANYFYWYLIVECEDCGDVTSTGNTKDAKVLQMYKHVLYRFSEKLRTGGPEMRERRAKLKRQQDFVDKLVLLMKYVAREPGNRERKIEYLRELLATSSETNSSTDIKFNFTHFDPLPLVLDPEIKIKGIAPHEAFLFKSSLNPARLTFITEDNDEYVAILKHGDDLRQDQLILQMIILMDKLLRRENLDLRLTPYRVLATSTKHGFVQFIESKAISDVLKGYSTIQNYFRRFAPAPESNSTYHILPEVLDNYVKSLAGYSVITYLLGVGDRHLDNLLLTKNGKMFHIDFGFILGRDPKPMPPPMKISQEMVDAMGGVKSEHFQEFRKQCYTAFLHLRRHGNLILNLFSLMLDASIPDIALEPDKTVKKIQDKLRMDLSDEEAVRYMANLIDVSVNSFMPGIMENFHRIAQILRS